MGEQLHLGHGHAQRGPLEQAFWRFHQDHPQVYGVLVRLAREWRGVHGPRTLGIAMLFERARWEIAMQTRDATGLKLNNNHRAYYARLMMEREGDLHDAFRVRRQRVQASIGPDGATVPPADQVY